MKKLLVVALLVLPSVAAVAGDVPKMREGNWEIVTTIDIPGLPIKMKPITATQCMTKEDVSDPAKSLPKAGNDTNCKVVDMKNEGNKATWSVKCDDEISSTGEITYTTDGYESIMRVKAEGQDMTMKMKAKRIGDCKK